MISAMIAKRVGEQMEPVGTIDVNEKGFKFETEDVELAKLLKGVQKDGIEAMSGDGIVDGIAVDRLERVKVTENCVAPLTDLLLDNGYHWWEEK